MSSCASSLGGSPARQKGIWRVAGQNEFGRADGGRTLATWSAWTLESSVEYGHGSAAKAGPTATDAAKAAPIAADWTRCCMLSMTGEVARWARSVGAAGASEDEGA